MPRALLGAQRSAGEALTTENGRKKRATGSTRPTNHRLPSIDPDLTCRLHRC